jgi:AGCS family alanine or glycine:cation symporter
MGKQWKPLAKLFAIFGISAGLLGIGTITQVNGIATAVQGFFDPNMENTVHMFGLDYSIATVATAIVVAILVALVVVGGLQRIASVTTIVVPFMAIVYVVVCVCILISNIDMIPYAVKEIFAGAFGLRAAAGGALGALMIAMQKGVARGIFSNEAGLGSAPIAAAAAQTREPVRQGLVSMTGTFVDTIVICAMTGLTLMVTGAYDAALANGLEGSQVTAYAFGNGLGWSSQMGSFVLMVCLAFFAFTTILGWDYYSERCFEYLTGKSGAALTAYRWVYVLAVLAGPFITVSAVWTLADICNGLMAIPNLIALLALSGVVVKETKDYFERLADGRLSA